MALQTYQVAGRENLTIAWQYSHVWETHSSRWEDQNSRDPGEQMKLHPASCHLILSILPAVPDGLRDQLVLLMDISD